jgi:hypothetical protein
VGYYGTNAVRNAIGLIFKGSKEWVDYACASLDGKSILVMEVDSTVYVRSLAKHLSEQLHCEGVLRRSDSGDRLDPDKSLKRNGVNNTATLRFDVKAVVRAHLQTSPSENPLRRSAPNNTTSS